MGIILTEPLREDGSVRVCKMNRVWEIPEEGGAYEGHEGILAWDDVWDALMRRGRR